MTQLKPIETVYKDFRFRSRLEARFAVFFDAMGEKWEYEKEGYNLNGTYYLPDFYLPRLKCFVEIKGETPNKEELDKCSMFRDYVGNAIAIVHGLPTENQGMLYCWDETDGSAGSSDWEFVFCDNNYGELNFCVEDRPDWRNFYMREFEEMFQPMLNVAPQGKLGEALKAAKQARFEHGESGYTERNTKRWMYGRPSAPKKRFLYGRDK